MTPSDPSLSPSIKSITKSYGFDFLNHTQICPCLFPFLFKASRMTTIVSCLVLVPQSLSPNHFHRATQVFLGFHAITRFALWINSKSLAWPTRACVMSHHPPLLAFLVSPVPSFSQAEPGPGLWYSIIIALTVLPPLTTSSWLTPIHPQTQLKRHVLGIPFWVLCTLNARTTVMIPIFLSGIHPPLDHCPGL